MKNFHDTISSISKTFIVMVVGIALTFGVILTIAIIVAKISFNLLFNNSDSNESSIINDSAKIHSSLK